MSGALYDGRTSKCPAVIETPFTQGQVPIQACPEGGSLGTSTGLPMNLRKTLIKRLCYKSIFKGAQWTTARLSLMSTGLVANSQTEQKKSFLKFVNSVSSGNIFVEDCRQG